MTETPQASMTHRQRGDRGIDCPEDASKHLDGIADWS